jgi:hypothetical protein
MKTNNAARYASFSQSATQKRACDAALFGFMNLFFHKSLTNRGYNFIKPGDVFIGILPDY